MTQQKYNFDSCPDRRNSGSLKWNKYRELEILPVWVADMDFVAAPEIVSALNERVEHGVYGYTVPYDSVIDAVVSYLKREHNYSIEEDWLNWLPGLVPALNLLCRVFADSNESVMTATPVYPPFLSAPVYSGRKLISVPLCLKNEKWTFDFKAMELAIRPDTRILILCNPHNPVGRVYSIDELTQLGNFCKKHDLVLISDEIHCDLIFDKTEKHVVAATINSEIAERTITLMSPSKTYNLPGLACAYSIIKSPKLRQKFQRQTRGIITEVNCFGYAGCEAAYNKGEPWRLAMLDYLQGNFKIMYGFIKDRIPEITFRKMEATYLAWLDISRLELKNPVTFFEENGIGLSDGTFFGSPQHVRLNFGCPRERLNEALEKIETAVRNR